MTTGNHEARIYRETGIDITKDIAKALGVPYRPEGMLHKLSFGDFNNRVKGKPFVFWGYISHGYGGARTKSAKAIKVERMASWIHADYYGMCLSEDTEILTRDGWVGINDVRLGQVALTLNRQRDLLEWKPINKIHKYNHFKQLINVRNRNVDILATPEHRIIYKWDNDYLELPLNEFIKLGGQVEIPRCGRMENFGV